MKSVENCVSMKEGFGLIENYKTKKRNINDFVVKWVRNGNELVSIATTDKGIGWEGYLFFTYMGRKKHFHSKDMI